MITIKYFSYSIDSLIGLGLGILFAIIYFIGILLFYRE